MAARYPIPRRLVPEARSTRTAKRTVKTDALPAQSEASFQRQVIALATALGYRHWHDNATNAARRCPSCGEVRRGPRNAPGMLDLILVRRPHLIWVELKAEDGEVSPEQQQWIDDLRASGQQVYVWRPSDWPEIERTLR